MHTELYEGEWLESPGDRESDSANSSGESASI
jgi:hypothetical protein